MSDKQTAEDATSEFGMGLSYCLGLFLAHAEREVPGGIDPDMHAELWFNAAADHLFELQVDSAPEDIRERLSEFKDRCLNLRLSISGPTAKDTDKRWAIQEAKDLLRAIDESHGVPTQKAGWE